MLFLAQQYTVILYLKRPTCQLILDLLSILMNIYFIFDQLSCIQYLQEILITQSPVTLLSHNLVLSKTGNIVNNFDRKKVGKKNQVKYYHKCHFVIANGLMHLGRLKQMLCINLFQDVRFQPTWLQSPSRCGMGADYDIPGSGRQGESCCNMSRPQWHFQSPVTLAHR